jgi:hypothetical protein
MILIMLEEIVEQTLVLFAMDECTCSAKGPAALDFNA